MPLCRRRYERKCLYFVVMRKNKLNMENALNMACGSKRKCNPTQHNLFY